MNTLGKILRTVAVILMGLTAALNILGGIGTTCAAFLLEKYPSMMDLVDFQWLYQALVILTVPVGIAGVWSTITLARGKQWAFRTALIILVLGTILGAVHFYASMSLRGRATPANMKLYINVITLLVFMILWLPGIRDRVGFSKPGGGMDGVTAGGLAAILTGCIVLSTASWAGPSHTYMGENWVELLRTPLNLSGTILVVGGLSLLVYLIWNAIRRELLTPCPGLALRK